MKVAFTNPNSTEEHKGWVEVRGWRKRKGKLFFILMHHCEEGRIRPGCGSLFNMGYIEMRFSFDSIVSQPQYVD